jgi:hypothetical protein
MVNPLAETLSEGWLQVSCAERTVGGYSGGFVAMRLRFVTANLGTTTSRIS